MADKPVTREEKYLAYLAGDYTGEIPKPITRKEKYLYELCLKGIGGEISPEEIKAAVNEYLEKNPVKPGATTEQARQIEQNKTDVASLKEDLGNCIRIANHTRLTPVFEKKGLHWSCNTDYKLCTLYANEYKEAKVYEVHKGKRYTVCGMSDGNNTSPLVIFSKNLSHRKR